MAGEALTLYTTQDSPDQVIQNPEPGRTYPLDGQGTIQNDTGYNAQLYVEGASTPAQQLAPGDAVQATDEQVVSVTFTSH
ncbi:hypothetical protein [Streptomyces mayteni]